MKRSSFYMKSLVAMLSLGMILSSAACGKKEETTTVATSSVEVTSETTPISSATTTTEATTLTKYGESLAPNDVPVSWTEETMEAKVMYVNVSKTGYLRIRKGPDAKYDQIGNLTYGMEVIVVAKTNNNWYKLEDGYYVSGEYLSLTKPS